MIQNYQLHSGGGSCTGPLVRESEWILPWAIKFVETWARAETSLSPSCLPTSKVLNSSREWWLWLPPWLAHPSRWVGHHWALGFYQSKWKWLCRLIAELNHTEYRCLIKWQWKKTNEGNVSCLAVKLRASHVPWEMYTHGNWTIKKLTSRAGEKSSSLLEMGLADK